MDSLDAVSAGVLCPGERVKGKYIEFADEKLYYTYNLAQNMIFITIFKVL